MALWRNLPMFVSVPLRDPRRSLVKLLFADMRDLHQVEKPGHSLSLKGRVLQSAKIAVKAMGYSDHAIFAEEL